MSIRSERRRERKAQREWDQKVAYDTFWREHGGDLCGRCGTPRGGHHLYQWDVGQKYQQVCQKFVFVASTEADDEGETQ